MCLGRDGRANYQATRRKSQHARCNPFYAEVNDSFWYLTEKLSDFRNRPDPP
jgi:hypothetical protein